MSVFCLRMLLDTFAALYMLLFAILFPEQNWKKRYLTNLSPRKVSNLYSFNFLSMPCPGWIVQMVLTSSRVPEWQNNTPRLNLFSYYGTVIAIVQLRLKFTSITSLIYNSHQPLFPKTSHYLCNFTSYLMQSCIFLWRLKKDYRKGLLKLQSLILCCHELVLVIINNECVTQRVCVYFIKGITTPAYCQNP